MNSFVKSTLVFIGGFAAGVASAYLAATHFLDIEFVNEEPESEKSPDENSKNPSENSEDSTEKEQNSNEEALADPFSESYAGVEGNDHYVDYTKLLNKITYNIDPESDDLYDNVIPEDVDIFGDPIAKPMVVDSVEFGQDFDYDEITLRHYEKQGLLTDDWDEPIENIEDTVGNEAMEKLRKGDSDAVYVKNDRLKAYYEIVCHIEDYPGISG